MFAAVPYALPQNLVPAGETTPFASTSLAPEAETRLPAPSEMDRLSARLPRLSVATKYASAAVERVRHSRPWLASSSVCSVSKSKNVSPNDGRITASRVTLLRKVKRMETSFTVVSPVVGMSCVRAPRLIEPKAPFLVKPLLLMLFGWYLSPIDSTSMSICSPL